jgi:hypothetical protein
MRSINRIGTRPASLPLSADNVVEFHAARLLLLLEVCGVAGRIDGLTKMAKLDFFARYPDFFNVAVARLPTRASSRTGLPEAADHRAVLAIDPLSERDDRAVIESVMVRHHYGPWDKRYYHVLAHLEAKALITVTKVDSTYRLALTDLGKQRAKALAAARSFSSLVERMREIKIAFGKKNGTFLKNHIYKVFEEQVERRPMGQAIK